MEFRERERELLKKCTGKTNNTILIINDNNNDCVCVYIYI